MIKKKICEWVKPYLEQHPIDDKKRVYPILNLPNAQSATEHLFKLAFQEREMHYYEPGAAELTAMDAAPSAPVARFKSQGVGTSALCLPSQGLFGVQSLLPPEITGFFAKQTFIGYQLCAILSQHWMIEKILRVPSEEAVSEGYDITVNDGSEIDPKILTEMRRLDISKYNIKDSLREFLMKGRMFGVRVAYLAFDVPNPTEFYENPFNIDSVKPGQYRGVIQIDPFWLVGVLGQDSWMPGTKHFYDPTWWQVGMLKIHRSHIVIFRQGRLADTLKPTYYYGGLPVPQLIYERVYQAERVANESSLLALTKRTKTYKVDLAAALAQGQKFLARMNENMQLQTNYGSNFIDKDEEYDQKDISLADFDNLIMNQYQLAAAAGSVHAVKILGTQLKGFNSTGEYEWKADAQTTTAYQNNDLTPLLKAHYRNMIVCDIAPKFGIEPFEIEISWNPLNPMTAEQKANVNKTKVDTDVQLRTAGVISPDEARGRLIADPDSGYNGLAPDAPEEEFDDEDEKDLFEG